MDGNFVRPPSLNSFLQETRRRRLLSFLSPDKTRRVIFGSMQIHKVGPTRTLSMKSSISRPMPTAPVVSSPIQPPPAKSSVSKFDVSQMIYGATKDVWAYGKTVPFVTDVLGLADAVATKVLDITFHVDYAAVDDKIKPQLKKLDDDIVTPAIETVWKIISPAVGKANEVVVEPVMKEFVPKVMASVVAPIMASFFVDEKKDQAKKLAIDMSPTPEIVPAFN